jgi:hypothetical protein
MDTQSIHHEQGPVVRIEGNDFLSLESTEGCAAPL